MRPRRSPERTAVILIAAVLSAIVASLLLAPMARAVGCPSTAGALDSSCREHSPQTLLGFEANVWLWGGTLVAIMLVAVWLIRRAVP